MAEEEQQYNENSLAEINSAFAQAWGEVYNEETPEAGATSTEEGGNAGEGAVSPTPPVESDGSTDSETPGAGSNDAAAVPNAGDLPGVQEGASDDAATPGDRGEGTGSGSTPTDSQSDRRSFSEYAPSFDAALKGINDKADSQFRAKALQDVREEIAPEYLEALGRHPRLLVGDTLPSVKTQGETEVIRDEQDAKSWQEAVKDVINRQVSQKATEYLTEAKPFLSSLQDSIEMFRQNPDIVPNTKEYNPELAKRFVSLAKSYEYRVDGKLIGYRVDVQPLIASLRTQVEADSKAAPAPTPRQEQVASQPRTATGQFDAPQAGIPSLTNSSGAAEDDYSAFWNAAGMGEMNI